VTIEPENSHPGIQRTRRNIMKMGAILVPATLGTVHSAKALEICLPVVGCFNIPIGGGRTPPAAAGIVS
jgi:hypothetical protein